jgi:hypothetical protein
MSIRAFVEQNKRSNSESEGSLEQVDFKAEKIDDPINDFIGTVGAHNSVTEGIVKSKVDMPEFVPGFEDLDPVQRFTEESKASLP